MMNSKRVLFCLALGTFALTFGCADDETEVVAEEVVAETTCGDGTCDGDETTASCAADCPPPCNGDGVCDADENFGTCPTDCNGLCAGADDSAFREAVAGMGAWEDADCGGNLQNDACVGGGFVGAEVACQGGTSEAICTAIGSCTWLDDMCAPNSLLGCAMQEDETTCGAASCLWDGEDEVCMPVPSEDNCTAATGVLAAQAISCEWNTDLNLCWSPKRGSDLASASAASCGLSCLTDPDPITCSIGCMKGEEQLGASLTDGCLTCYAAALGCTLANCVVECAAISTKCDAECSDECQATLAGCSTCRATKGCNEAFSLCADGPAPTEG